MLLSFIFLSPQGSRGLTLTTNARYLSHSLKANELVDLTTCELVSWSIGYLLINVWNGPKDVVTHQSCEQGSRCLFHRHRHLVASERAAARRLPNLRGSCGPLVKTVILCEITSRRLVNCTMESLTRSLVFNLSRVSCPCHAEVWVWSRSV